MPAELRETRHLVPLSFSDEAYNRLLEIQGKTNAENPVKAIQKALRVCEWVADQQRLGRIIAVLEDDTVVGKTTFLF